MSLRRAKTMEAHAKIKELFGRLDKGGDGVIEAKDLGNVLQRIGIATHDIGSIFHDMDKDGNGVISIDEFTDWVLLGADVSVDQLDRYSAEEADVFKVPSPCQSGSEEDLCVIFDVSRILEFPTCRVTVSLAGIHRESERYIGVNMLRLLDEGGRPIEFTVARADGRAKDEARQSRRPEGEPWMRFCIFEGCGPWWAVPGPRHEVELHIPGGARVNSVAMWCVNQNACPKEMRVKDSDVDNKHKHGKAGWSKDRMLALGGCPQGVFESVLQGSTPCQLDNLIADLNAGKLRCPRGFASFYPASVDDGACVLYLQGNAKAARRYFGLLCATEPGLRDAPDRAGCVIAKTEERALTLRELRELRATIIARCCQERWNVPGAEATLQPEDVNLYQFSHHHICPWTVPQGVVLQGVKHARYDEGQEIEQPGPHGSARGRVVQQTIGQDLRVRATAGAFRVGAPIIVEGQDRGTPSAVEHAGSCSYKELIADRAMPPRFFCSHWWGESVLDFVRCCEEHAAGYQVDENNASYWVCAYANRQHDLGQDLTVNPEETSFRKAMILAQGILVILDEDATAFRRIWCDFEIYTTVREPGKTIDIVTMQGERPRLLSHGLLPGETSFEKAEREKQFPLKLLGVGLCTELQNGESSVAIDKTRILNCMIGNMDNLDSEDVVRRLQSGGSHKARDLQKHDVWAFNFANFALHRLVATAAWPLALKKGIVQQFPTASGNVSLPTIVGRDSSCKDIALHFGSFDEVTDAEIEVLLSSLPAELGALRLNLAMCRNLSNEGLTRAAGLLPAGLHTLVLVLDGVVNDEGFQALVFKLRDLPGLRRLALSAHVWGNDQERRAMTVTAESLQVLGACMPSALSSLKLDVTGALSAAPGLAAVFAGLPAGLVELEVRMGRLVSDKNFPPSGVQLPKDLRRAVFSLETDIDIAGVTNLEAVAAWMPRGLEDFGLQFAYSIDQHGRSKISPASVHAMGKALPASLKNVWVNTGLLRPKGNEVLACVPSILADAGVGAKVKCIHQIHKFPDFVVQLA